MSKTLTLGLSRPLSISLDDPYFDVLFAMASMEGKEPEALAKEFLQFYVKDHVRGELECIADHSTYGKLLLQGWLDTLEGKD